MRKLLLVIVVLGGLLVAADFVARGLVAEKLAGRVAASLRLEREPEVELEGFPFVTQILGGELDGVTMSLDDISEQDVTLSSFSISLERVRFSFEDLLDQGGGQVRVAAADGRAELDQGDLASVLSAAGAPFEATIDQGRLLATSDAAAQQVEIQPRIEGSQLILEVPQLGSTAIPLPTPIRGITYDSVEVVPGSIHLRFSSGPAVLRAPA